MPAHLTLERAEAQGLHLVNRNLALRWSEENGDRM